MVCAQDASLVLSDLLVQGDGFIEALSRRVCVCQAVACGERAGVVGTQDTGLAFDGACSIVCVSVILFERIDA